MKSRNLYGARQKDVLLKKLDARVLKQALNIVMCLRSYYPLYPPPLGACLDTSLGQALNMPCTPDIVLFPSDLAPFAKVVSCGGVPDQAAASSAASHKTVCINPGRLVKDKSGATYAWVQVRILTVMQVAP